MDIELFKFTKEMIGQSFEVRFIPNLKDIKNSMYNYKFHYSEFKGWNCKYISIATINNNLCYFNFGETVRKFLLKNSDSKNRNKDVFFKFFNLDIGSGIKIDISEKEGFMALDISEISDNKFIINDGKVLEEINKMDLKTIFYQELFKLKDVSIKVPADPCGGRGGHQNVILGDIYARQYPDYVSEIRDYKINKIIN